MKMKITIGIPAYNEEKNIAGIITKLKKYTNGTKYSEARGKSPSENLIKPYPAILSSIAASNTEPAVGAST